MFCSKCGKSLPLEGSACPSCGYPIGESRFAASAYTSAQVCIRPGDDIHRIFSRSYVRSASVNRDYEAVRRDDDARTTYRPDAEEAAHDDGYESAEYAQENEQGPASAYEDGYDPYEGLSDEARNTLIQMDETLEMEGIDRSKYAPQPIESMGQEGIDPDVSELMMSIERGKSRRSLRARRRAAYDDYIQDQPEEEAAFADAAAEPAAPAAEEAPAADQEAPAEAAAPQSAAPVEDVLSAEDAAPAEDVLQEAADPGFDPGFDDAEGEQADYGDEQSDVFDEVDDEEFEEMRHSSFSLSKLLKVLAMLVAASVIIVVGMMWVNHIQGSTTKAPIENVREAFYDSGLAMIREHAVADQYNSLIASGGAGDMVSLAAALQSSSAEINALLPEDATENEKLFLSALNRIETNIGNCITSDAIAVASKDESSLEKSDERWTVVQNSITMLESAKSATELTAIVNGEVVDVLEPTPEPTPEPKVNYDTLSKGDKSDAVFELQNRLYELGFLNDDRDGAFGSKTQTAVKMFQQVVGLPTTGIADSATQEALFAEDAPRTPMAPGTAQ